jgi:hypothetical protein
MFSTGNFKNSVGYVKLDHLVPILWISISNNEKIGQFFALFIHTIPPTEIVVSDIYDFCWMQI